MDKGPYPATIWYLQRESKPIRGVVLSCGGYPINRALSRVGEISSSEYGRNPTKENQQGFICP